MDKKKYQKKKNLEIKKPTSEKKTSYSMKGKTRSSVSQKATTKLSISQKLSAAKKKKKSSGNIKVASRQDKDITKIEEFVYQVKVGQNSSVYLVGTAHVSKKSVELVKKTLDKYKPEVVYLELDEEREESLSGNRFRKIDLLKIIKENKVIFFIFYLLIGIFQKKIAEKYGSSPGGEFLAALKWANAHSRKVVLVDRNAQITVKRAWRSMGLGEQIRFLFSGFTTSSGFEEEFDLEKMKEDDVLTDLIKKLSVRFPRIKQIVIDERDEYMSREIIRDVKEYESRNQKIVSQNKGKRASQPRKIYPKGILGLAVVGAGHLAGMRSFLEAPSNGKRKESYESVPPPHFFWRMLPWAFTGIVGFVFIFGFWFTNWETVRNAFFVWSLITGGLSSLGVLLAGGHPLVIVIAFVSAPITTLHPILGVGFFTAITQFYFCPPRMSDFENLSLKITQIRTWWQNRVTRIFLVFLFSSLGAAAGMWIALTKLITVFS